MIDLEAAKRDPNQVFNTPHDIVINNELTHEQKLDLLKRWAYDILEDTVAEDENMASFDASDKTLLDNIINAYHDLGEVFILPKNFPSNEED